MLINNILKVIGREGFVKEGYIHHATDSDTVSETVQLVHKLNNRFRYMLTGSDTLFPLQIYVTARDSDRRAYKPTFLTPC